MEQQKTSVQDPADTDGHITTIQKFRTPPKFHEWGAQEKIYWGTQLEDISKSYTNGQLTGYNTVRMGCWI